MVIISDLVAAPSWDVFLSFYGKDTRGNFISHLYKALDQAGIKTFMDEPELRKGEEISGELLSAIHGSNMSVVVLSQNYAHSKWCLNELVEILSCKRINGQMVIPVFHYVDPSDVRNYKGSFGEALESQMKLHSEAVVDKWKSALSEIGKLKGYHLQKNANENESNTIQEIVEKVAPQASTKVLHVEEYLFGIDHAVEEIYQKLSMKLNDVRAIGICGMGGIGKTTTAKAFHNKFSNKFDLSCFIDNVKQYSQRGNPLLSLMEQVLIDFLRWKDYKVPDVESGIRKLKEIIYSRKALIVLDDLDQSSYSEFLVRICNLFSAGSRIVVTTRDANLINQLKVDISGVDLYMVRKLGDTDSLQLFSHHAFGKPLVPECFRELSLSFVTYAGGLPLALKVLGSSFRGRTQVSFWKAKLEKVQKIQENDIQKILQLSYDELEDETYKAIFLDIAFFFVGKDKDEAAMVFKSCDFIPDVGIPILVDRCLLTIDTNNKFQMHNLIQDMGRRLGRSTRLFLQENAWKDLQNQEGRNNIEGLVLDLRAPRDGQIIASWFEKMPNLRLLQIIGAPDVKGNFKNLFPQLRCIRWHSCPWTRIPSAFRPRNLVSIDMPSSKFKTLWRGPLPIKQLNNLYGLYLSGCHYLKRLPEQLGEMKGLKKIDVSRTAIEKLPDSITQLKELAELHLRFCEKLTNLPDRFGEMKGLKELNAGSSAIEKLPDSITQLKELFSLDLRSCKKLTNLPDRFGEMKGLKKLHAGSSAIEKLPDSITQLKELVSLDLRSCKKLTNLPEQIGNMEGLRTFDAGHTAIEQLPDSFVGLSNLKSLSLKGCENLRNLPENIWKLKLLKTLDLTWCSKLRNLPDSIWKLKLLKALDLTWCSKLERLPKQLGEMQCLESLWASYTAIREVPDSIRLLSRLQILSLDADEKLKYGPESIRNLTSIQSLYELNKLTALHLSCNVRLCLPMILCFLSLKVLTLNDEEQNFRSAEPVSLSQLFNLQVLALIKCTSLGPSLPELPLNLKELCIRIHSSLEQLPDLSYLKLLGRLSIYRCDSLRSISILPSHLRSLSVVECDSLRSISILPSHLRSLSVEECTSLQDLPDLSMLKELETLDVTECNNLKSISLKESSLQVGPYSGGPYSSFTAYLPNREVAEWFNYKSSGRTVSFDIPPSIGSNFLGLALWVVYTCSKSTNEKYPYIKAVITNNTERITKNYPICVFAVVGEVLSKVECIPWENMPPMKSGDKIKVSIRSTIYSDYTLQVPVGKVKVMMCGVHVIQDTTR